MILAAASSHSQIFPWVIVGSVAVMVVWWVVALGPRFRRSPRARRETAKAALIAFGITGAIGLGVFLYGQFLGAHGYRALSGRGAVGLVIGVGVLGWRAVRFGQRRWAQRTASQFGDQPNNEMRE